MMKRFLTVLLAMALVTTFASCSKDEGDVTDQSEVTTEDMGTKETPDADSSFEQGSVAQQTYKNEFIGIGCTLGEGWTFYDSQQIASLNKDGGNTFYDMYAKNDTTAQTAEITLQKLTRIQVISVDIETMYNSQAPMMKAEMEQNGASDFSYTLENITVANKSGLAMNISAKVNGKDVNKLLFTIKTGEYLTSLTVTSDSYDSSCAILDGFFGLGVNN